MCANLWREFLLLIFFAPAAKHEMWHPEANRTQQGKRGGSGGQKKVIGISSKPRKRHGLTKHSSNGNKARSKTEAHAGRDKKGTDKGDSGARPVGAAVSENLSPANRALKPKPKN